MKVLPAVAPVWAVEDYLIPTLKAPAEATEKKPQETIRAKDHRAFLKATMDSLTK